MPSDLDKLQGTWHITSLQADGQDMPDVASSGSTIVVVRNRFTSMSMGQSYEGTVKLDSTKTPRAIDLLFTSGPQQGKRNRGIYKITGGRWTMCLATRGDQRPKTFATKPDTGLALETLERAGSAPKSQQRQPAAKMVPTVTRQVSGSGPPTELEGEWDMVAGVFNGDAMQQNMVAWCKRITRGDVTMVVAGPQVFVHASFSVDRSTPHGSTRPHAIDYVNVAGTHKGKSQAGIFELAGGVLRICMSAPSKPRPKTFESTRGDGRSFTTWRLARR